MNKHSEVLAQVFVDENNDFHPDVADSLSYSSEQVFKTGRQDSVEISFQTLFDGENNSSNTSDILSSSFTDC